MKTVSTFVIESKFLRSLTLGGGLLSIITLTLTILNMIQGLLEK